MANEFLEAALGYAKMGLSVIPLLPRKKKPFYENWPEIATSDLEVISRWWQQNPQCNVGIATGAKSRMFVLDIDPKNGGDDSFQALSYKHGTPDTWRDNTGSGGMHFFFRYPNFPVGNKAGIWPGIDIRGDGGQVVAPPSIHPDTGRRYEWDGIEEIKWATLQDAPAWVLDAIQGNTRKSGEVFSLTDEKIPKGVQHMTLVSLAGALRRMGLQEAEIFPVLMQVNTVRCTEPGEAKNIQQIAHSVMRYAPADKNLWKVAATVWREHARIVHQREKQKSSIEDDPINATAMSGRQVFALPSRDPEMVIGNTLSHGYTLLAGRPKSGKSWIALQVALSVANGSTLRGAPGRLINPGRVEYLALEDSPHRTSRRMHLLLQGQDSIMLDNIDFCYSVKPPQQGGLESIDARLTARKPSLVIIDTLRALVNGGSVSRDIVADEYSFADKLHKMAERHRTAILVLHHTNKLGSVAGTYGMIAGPDAIWLFKRDPGQQDATLEITGRDLEEQSLALRFSKDPMEFGWNVIGEGNDAMTRIERDELLTVLRMEGQQTVSQLATKVHKSYSQIMKLLDQLVATGEVGRGDNRRFYAGPVRQDCSDHHVN